MLTAVAVTSQCLVAVQALSSIRQIPVRWPEPVKRLLDLTRLMILRAKRNVFFGEEKGIFLIALYEVFQGLFSFTSWRILFSCIFVFLIESNHDLSIARGRETVKQQPRTFDFDIIRLGCIYGTDSPILKSLSQLLFCPIGCALCLFMGLVGKFRGKPKPLDTAVNHCGTLLFAFFLSITVRKLGLP